jgi:integrase
MTSATARRFENNVDRSGEHHLWTGAIDPRRGTGRAQAGGRQTTAHRLAWELVHGALPDGARVLQCPEVPTCVRVDHLAIDEAEATARSRPRKRQRARGRQGSGSKRRLPSGRWQLSVVAETNGRRKRVFRTVEASSDREAEHLLAAFLAEVAEGVGFVAPESRDLTVDDAMRRFLFEHLRDNKGREEKTVKDYWRLCARWFSPVFGNRAVRSIALADLDGAFGKMQKAGLSSSRLNQARSVFKPFFRWAIAHQYVARNPMRDFELPKSSYVSRPQAPPEVEELTLFLREAHEATPEILPLLALGAVTGMRRGELVGLRWSAVRWEKEQLVVDVAVGEGGLKGTKTRRSRTVDIDEATVGMLRRHRAEMEGRAAFAGGALGPGSYVFSLTTDCSAPMPPDYVTKQVAVLKERLGVANKRRQTVELEDAALALFRGERQGRSGMTGPAPQGALSYREIGRQLGRSQRWAVGAVQAASRREAAAPLGIEHFDASILALRKFTSSELLDAGFNISLVADRQGHGPGVLLKHYARGRGRAKKEAAAHLGRVVHGVAANA